jgi:hypothetical protein
MGKTKNIFKDKAKKNREIWKKKNFSFLKKQEKGN